METPNTTSLRSEEWKTGWRIPAISALGIGVSMIPVYSLGPLMPAIHIGTGWTRSSISLGPTFMSAGAVLLAPLVGTLVDRVGSRRVALPGLVIFCAALASLAFTNNHVVTWWLVWTLIAIAVVFIKITVWTTAVVTRFRHARGAAVGLALTGTGLSSFCVPYLTTLLQESYGWHTAYAVLASGGLVLSFPLAYLFFSDAHSSARRNQPAEVRSAEVDRISLPGVPIRQAFLSRIYFQMGLAALLSAMAGTALSVHFVPILRSEGLSAHTAAATAGGLGVALVLGALGGGYLLDKLSGPTVGFIALAMPVLACPALLISHTAAAGLFAAALVGASAGAEINVYASIIPLYFGVRNFGVLFAVVDAIITVGFGIGPFTAGTLFDRFGNYHLVLMLSVPLFLISALLLGFLGPAPRRPETHGTMASFV